MKNNLILIARSNTHLIKLTDDFVEQSKTLESLLVDVALIVKFLIIGYRSKHDSNTRISFVIEILSVSCAEEMLGDMGW